MHCFEENARLIQERLQKELAEIEQELLITTKQIKRYEQMVKEVWLNFRRQLNHQTFTEISDLTNDPVYGRACQQINEVLLELGALKEREKQLELRQKELANNLKNSLEYLTAVMQRKHLASEIIRAQEEERRRVAREIHDGPAQSMANVILRAELCEKLLDLDPEAVRKELGEFKILVQKSLQDMRRIIFDLRPMSLDDLGLVPALKRYLEILKERYHITMNIELNYSGEPLRLAPSIEVAIYRVIQEALLNTIKHAEATSVQIYLEFSPECLTARVIDNGKGFPAEKYLQNPEIDSFGLLGMKERLEILNGQLSIKSQPGVGTEIIAILPLGF